MMRGGNGSEEQHPVEKLIEEINFCSTIAKRNDPIGEIFNYKEVSKLVEIARSAVFGLETLMSDKRNCACEPGGYSSPEFICGGHAALLKIYTTCEGK